LDRRIVAKPVGVVAVFVAERDLVNALAELLTAARGERDPDLA